MESTSSSPISSPISLFSRFQGDEGLPVTFNPRKELQKNNIPENLLLKPLIISARNTYEALARLGKRIFDQENPDIPSALCVESVPEESALGGYQYIWLTENLSPTAEKTDAHGWIPFIVSETKDAEAQLKLIHSEADCKYYFVIDDGREYINDLQYIEIALCRARTQKMNGTIENTGLSSSPSLFSSISLSDSRGVDQALSNYFDNRGSCILQVAGGALIFKKLSWWQSILHWFGREFTNWTEVSKFIKADEIEAFIGSNNFDEGAPDVFLRILTNLHPEYQQIAEEVCKKNDNIQMKNAHGRFTEGFHNLMKISFPVYYAFDSYRRVDFLKYGTHKTLSRYSSTRGLGQTEETQGLSFFNKSVQQGVSHKNSLGTNGYVDGECEQFSRRKSIDFSRWQYEPLEMTEMPSITFPLLKPDDSDGEEGSISRQERTFQNLSESNPHHLLVPSNHLLVPSIGLPDFSPEQNSSCSSPSKGFDKVDLEILALKYFEENQSSCILEIETTNLGGSCLKVTLIPELGILKRIGNCFYDLTKWDEVITYLQNATKLLAIVDKKRIETIHEIFQKGTEFDGISAQDRKAIAMVSLSPDRYVFKVDSSINKHLVAISEGDIDSRTRNEGNVALYLKDNTKVLKFAYATLVPIYRSLTTGYLGPIINGTAFAPEYKKYIDTRFPAFWSINNLFLTCSLPSRAELANQPSFRAPITGKNSSLIQKDLIALSLFAKKQDLVLVVERQGDKEHLEAVQYSVKADTGENWKKVAAYLNKKKLQGINESSNTEILSQAIQKIYLKLQLIYIEIQKSFLQENPEKIADTLVIDPDFEAYLNEKFPGYLLIQHFYLSVKSPSNRTFEEFFFSDDESGSQFIKTPLLVGDDLDDEDTLDNLHKRLSTFSQKKLLYDEDML